MQAGKTWKIINGKRVWFNIDGSEVKFDRKAYNIKYNEKNKEILKNKGRQYYIDNKDEINVKHRIHAKTYNRRIEVRYKNAKRDASKKNKCFDLTYEEYIDLINQPCYYCSNILGKPVEVRIGLDRLDNMIGYVPYNCVSCCDFCNSIKQDKLTSDEMRVVAQAIINLRNKGLK